MINQQLEPRKYKDSAGNVYGIERSFKTGLWVVIRTNAGGNRKGVKSFGAGKPGVIQKALDDAAKVCGWMEVE